MALEQGFEYDLFSNLVLFNISTYERVYTLKAVITRAYVVNLNYPKCADYSCKVAVYCIQGVFDMHVAMKLFVFMHAGQCCVYYLLTYRLIYVHVFTNKYVYRHFYKLCTR